MKKTRKRRGTGRVTLQDVAEHAGVGSMTVSRALRKPDQVSEKLREKISAAIEMLGYIPNGTAGALASASSSLVAVQVASLTDYSSALFVQSLQREFDRYRLQLLLGCHEYQPAKEAQVLRMLLQSNPSAVVLFASPLTQASCELIAKSAVPLINVAGNPSAHDSVTLNIPLFDAAYQVTEHLLERGARHIGFIGASTDNRVQQQLNGWHKSMIARYRNSDLAVVAPQAPDMRMGRDALDELLLRQPELDAVLCSHEHIALGVLAECRRRLLQVPQSMVVACLNGSDNCDYCYPSVTSVRIDYEKLGRETGKLLTDWLRAPGERVARDIPYRLMLRQSS